MNPKIVRESKHSISALISVYLVLKLLRLSDTNFKLDWSFSRFARAVLKHLTGTGLFSMSPLFRRVHFKTLVVVLMNAFRRKRRKCFSFLIDNIFCGGVIIARLNAIRNT